MKTIQIIDGRWYRLGNVSLHECCGCGLVHSVKHKLVRGMIFEQWTVNDYQTRKARKQRLKKEKR